MLVVNVGHPEGSDSARAVLAATLRTEFGRVLRDPVDADQRHAHGRARPGRRRPAGACRAAAAGAAAAVAAGTAARLAPAPAAGAVWTDDRAPVEWLIDSSIVDYAAHGGR